MGQRRGLYGAGRGCEGYGEQMWSKYIQVWNYERINRKLKTHSNGYKHKQFAKTPLDISSYLKEAITVSPHTRLVYVKDTTGKH